MFSIRTSFHAKGIFDTFSSVKSQDLLYTQKSFKGGGGSSKPSSVRLVKLIPKSKKEKCIKKSAPKPAKKSCNQGLKNVVPNVDRVGKEICKKTIPANPCYPYFGHHNPKRSRNIFLFVCLPLMILQLYIVAKHEENDAFAKKFQQTVECPNYEYLHRRTKRFPWGDGKNSLFHNERNISGEECLAKIEQKKVQEENLKAKQEETTKAEECEEEEEEQKEKELEKEKEKEKNNAKGKKC